MKATIQAHVSPWSPPTKVHFDEGLKLPLDCVPDEVIVHLCHEWMRAVTEAAGMNFELKMSRKDPHPMTRPDEKGRL